MCPHTTICVPILLCMCPRTTIHVSSSCNICVHCMCVPILLYMCPHTTIYVSSYCNICVLILQYMRPLYVSSGLCSQSRGILSLCPHTTIYVSSYYYICVLMLQYMCPRTTIYVSSCCNIWVYCVCVLRSLKVAAYCAQECRFLQLSLLALLVQILTHNFTLAKAQILTHKNAVERFIGQHTRFTSTQVLALLVQKYK